MVHLLLGYITALPTSQTLFDSELSKTTSVTKLLLSILYFYEEQSKKKEKLSRSTKVLQNHHIY